MLVQVMLNREDDHIYRASRPIVLWLAINNISRHFCIPEEAMLLIHTHVRHLHPGENEGFLAFSDRLERERRAMVRAGAEPPMPFHRLMGFRTFVGFVSHREHERRLEQAKNQRDAIEAMAQWELFGFSSSRAFKRAKRTEEKMTGLGGGGAL